MCLKTVRTQFDRMINSRQASLVRDQHPHSDVCLTVLAEIRPVLCHQGIIAQVPIVHQLCHAQGSERLKT